MKVKKWRGADVNQIFKKTIIKLRSEQEKRVPRKENSLCKVPLGMRKHANYERCQCVWNTDSEEGRDVR